MPEFKAHNLWPIPVYESEILVKDKWKDNSSDLALQLILVFESVENFDAATIEVAIKKYLEENKIGIGAVMPIVRILLTGGLTGPAVFDIAAILGKEETVSRIKNGISIIGK